MFFSAVPFNVAPCNTPSLVNVNLSQPRVEAFVHDYYYYYSVNMAIVLLCFVLVLDSYPPELGMYILVLPNLSPLPGIAFGSGVIYVN